MEFGAILWLILFGLIIIIVLTILLLIINKLSPEVEPGKTWLEAMDEFKQKHPVWNFSYTFLPKPLNILLQLIGPKRPKYVAPNE